MIRSTIGRPQAGLRARGWSVASVAVVVLFAAWSRFGGPDDRARQIAADLVPLGLEIVVVALAIACARRGGTRRERWAWSLVALAYALYLSGDGLWAFFELVQDRSPFPSAADGFYLAFYPVLLGGLLALPGPPRRANEWRRLGLDVLTVLIAGSMTVWYLVIGPTLDQGSGRSLSTVLSLAYPVGDLVLLLGVATVIIRGMDAGGAFGLRWMATGASAFVVADVGFAHLSLNDGYEAGSWPDIGWLIALVCFVVAAEGEHRRPAEPRPEGRHESPVRVSLLPYLAIASSFALLIYVGFSQAGANVRTLLLLVLALTATVVVRQITALNDGARMSDAFQRLAETDPLTSLSNRRHLLDLADHRFAEARRKDDDLALIYIDVDHFKSINDVYGHAVGDAVLVWLAEQLRTIMRDEDLIGRFGGDEFVAVVPGLGEEAVLAMASDLERSIRSTRFPLEEGPEEITLSLGVATSIACTDLDDLLTHADAALYRAKRSGRARACVLERADALAGG